MIIGEEEMNFRVIAVGWLIKGNFQKSNGDFRSTAADVRSDEYG